MRRPAPGGLVVAIGASFALCGGAAGQPAKPTPPPSASTPQTGVVRPPANVDPKMKLAPKPQAHFPTPVVKPRPEQGDTVVVPK